MDVYQFIAAIFQSLVSLAWPAALIVCVWLFREKLNVLLPLLRMKYKDFDVSFRLEQAEKEAAQIPPAPPSITLEPTPEEKSRFDQLVQISPRSAIVEIRAELEDALKDALQRRGRLLDKPVTMVAATRILRNEELIDGTTSALLDDLRVIGNEASHSSEREFTKDDALKVRKLANQAIQRLSVI